MMSFRVQFHRYSSASGSRLSAPRFIEAENFNDAARRAELMRSAMQETDLGNSYIIAFITTEGLRGETCTMGWETDAEFSKRVGAEVSDTD